MRRSLVVVTGVLLGFAAGLATLGTGLAVEAVALNGGAAADLLALAAWVGEGTASRAATQGLALLWAGALALCLGPVTVTALLGEATGQRGFGWCTVGTGAVAAAVPTLVRAILDLPVHGAASPAESSLTLLLFLVGLASGFVDWLVAGRSGGRE